jgi:hypothetical protein
METRLKRKGGLSVSHSNTSSSGNLSVKDNYNMMYICIKMYISMSMLGHLPTDLKSGESEMQQLYA